MSAFPFLGKAQTDYVLNGNMTGTALNYVSQSSGVNSPAAGTNPGWTAYFSSTTSVNRGLDIVTTTDVVQGDVIKITTTGNNTDLANNARLVQRLCVSGSTALAPIGLPVGVYTLKFKARATSTTSTTLVATLRSTASNTPAFLINGYTTGTYPASKSITFTDQAWAEYTVDFDLTKTVTSFAPSPTITTGLTANQYPVICFSIQSPVGAECMVDDVSFINKSPSGLNDIYSNQNQIKYQELGKSLIFSDVQGKVFIYDAIGKVVKVLQSENNEAVFNISHSGLYIVRNGNRTSKFEIN